MEEKTAIVTEEKETQLERRVEMRALKNEIEAHLKEIMQEKMNELELKVDNKMDQLTKDLDGIKASLHAQAERLTNCEMQLKGVSDMKTVPALEKMRDEFEKMKLEQTRLALKAKEDSEATYTVKGRADAFIQLLEQKDERMIKELNEYKTNMNTKMDVYKNQLEEVKTTIASVDKDWGRESRALDQMESKILDTMKDQIEWLGTVKQLRKDERSREMEQTKQNGNEWVLKLEKMEAQINKDGDELRLNVDNQMTAIIKQLDTIENIVKENENKLTAFDNKVTIIGNEVATIDNRVTTDDNEITTINNGLATIENKVDANDNRITKTDKKVAAMDNRITTTDKKIADQISDVDDEVTAINTRLTWMEEWQKKLRNLGLFCSLSQRDGWQVSEIIFPVKNIAKEITKAKYNEQHYVECQPFYTNITGYRATMRVYPNDRNTNHVGVYLSLVKGEFDDIVSWPFKCKYEFYSVTPDGTRFASVSVDPSTKTSPEAFMRPKVESDAFGIPEYIKSEKLLANKDQYLIDGSLHITAAFWLNM